MCFGFRIIAVFAASGRALFTVHLCPSATTHTKRRHSKQDAVVTRYTGKWITSFCSGWHVNQCVWPGVWQKTSMVFESLRFSHQHNAAASLFPLFSFNCWDLIGARLVVSVKMIYYSELVLVGGKKSTNFMAPHHPQMLLIIHYFAVWRRMRRYKFKHGPWKSHEICTALPEVTLDISREALIQGEKSRHGWQRKLRAALIFFDECCAAGWRYPRLYRVLAGHRFFWKYFVIQA